MMFRAPRIVAAALSFAAGVCVFAHAGCPVDVVIVKGRVEHAPTNASVRVRLVYVKEQLGESGEVTVEGAAFSIPIEFLTQSRKPVVNGLFEKCDRKPKSVIVTLVRNSHEKELDRVSLDFARDFHMTDTSAYA